MNLIKRLFGKKIKVKGFLIIDLSDETIKLPSGKRIPVKYVIKIDSERGVIIYRDRDGSIKEEPYIMSEKELIDKIAKAMKETEMPVSVYA